MATQELILKLPINLFQQLANVAKLTQQSIESLAIQSISSNLPPTIENAPLEMQASLQSLQNRSIEELLKIADSQIPTTQQQRHLELLERHQETESMAPEERQELRELGQAADQLMLTKAYAWAILRWRGYRIPSLTATGRATVIALRMNNEYIVESRRLWVSMNWHPPTA